MEKYANSFFMDIEIKKMLGFWGSRISKKFCKLQSFIYNSNPLRALLTLAAPRFCF